ncbi:hypothetical protein ASZ90_006995 [hydrocarbon metagenome]|uniref:Uncharacterized protein n=1 Tax=hydrocarbon metagenome TaxID=938273 RepID=A0A0W8FSD4_9ZZZZ
MTGAVLSATGVSSSAGFKKYIVEKTTAATRITAAEIIYFFIETGVLWGGLARGFGIFVPQTGHL